MCCDRPTASKTFLAHSEGAKLALQMEGQQLCRAQLFSTSCSWVGYD